MPQTSFPAPLCKLQIRIMAQIARISGPFLLKHNFPKWWRRDYYIRALFWNTLNLDICWFNCKPQSLSLNNCMCFYGYNIALWRWSHSAWQYILPPCSIGQIAFRNINKSLICFRRQLIPLTPIANSICGTYSKEHMKADKRHSINCS